MATGVGFGGWVVGAEWDGFGTVRERWRWGTCRRRLRSRRGSRRGRRTRRLRSQVAAATAVLTQRPIPCPGVVDAMHCSTIGRAPWDQMSGLGLPVTAVSTTAAARATAPADQQLGPGHRRRRGQVAAASGDGHCEPPGSARPGEAGPRSGERVARRSARGPNRRSPDSAYLRGHPAHGNAATALATTDGSGGSLGGGELSSDGPWR